MAGASVIQLLLSAGLLAGACTDRTETIRRLGHEHRDTAISEALLPADSLPPDTAAYYGLLRHLAHGKPAGWWPAAQDGPPQPGALLPYHRIVAYYGNLYAAGMGILGALPEHTLMEKLKAETARWSAADTLLPTVPALHYIAVTAQRTPGKDKMYRLRMPHTEVEKVIAMARRHKAIVFLDIQPGHSNVLTEAMQLSRYLAMPDVHLGIDPEYNMPTGQIPSSTVGTIDAADINAVSAFLARVTQENNLPPKMLVVHRFTKAMVTREEAIVRRPEVQLVLNMDGFGSPAKKKDTYRSFIGRRPVQFTGFKIFYDVDVRTGGRLMLPQEVLQLHPSPVYIQYQ